MRAFHSNLLGASELSCWTNSFDWPMKWNALKHMWKEIVMVICQWIKQTLQGLTKLIYTAEKISTCSDWKITCPVGHATTKVYVPWDKIYMPSACGHALCRPLILDLRILLSTSGKQQIYTQKYSQGAVQNMVLNIGMLVQQHIKQKLSHRLFNMKSLWVEKKKIHRCIMK